VRLSFVLRDSTSRKDWGEQGHGRKRNVVGDWGVGRILTLPPNLVGRDSVEPLLEVASFQIPVSSA